MLEFARVLGHVSTISVGAPLVLMLIYKKRTKHKYFARLRLLLFCSLLTDIASLIVIKTYLLSATTYLLNIHHLIQFILLLLIYRELYMKEKKLFVVILCAVYFGFEIGNSIFFQKLTDHQTWSKVLSSIIFVGLSAGYFAHLLKSNPMVNIAEFAPSWINIAVFIYFGFSLYLFTMAEYVFHKESTETAIIFWGFHNVNNILKNCIYAVAIYWGGRTNSNN